MLHIYIYIYIYNISRLRVKGIHCTYVFIISVLRNPKKKKTGVSIKNAVFNPLNAELNPICHLLAFLGAHHILHISRIRVKTC